jgi:hypothetical protein
MELDGPSVIIDELGMIETFLGDMEESISHNRKSPFCICPLLRRLIAGYN